MVKPHRNRTLRNSRAMSQAARICEANKQRDELLDWIQHNIQVIETIAHRGDEELVYRSFHFLRDPKTAPAELVALMEKHGRYIK